MGLTGKAAASNLLRGKIKDLNVIYTDTYEIAVKNGFEGTVDEWLKALVNGGIASIEQTTTSTEDDGKNVITVTLADGTQEIFTVENGSKGDKGDKGDPGADGAGRTTEEGGVIFGDYASLAATENAAAFGGKIDRSGSNGDPTQESLDANPDLWRHSEASQPGAIAGGLGAYALARASKSLGYRTQTGYALKKHLKETTFQTADGEVTAVDPSVVPYVLKDGSYAETYEQIMAENKGSLPGQGAVAIGSDTAALANNSFAGGYRAEALNNNSFAFGSHAIAKGECAVALGSGTETGSSNAFVAGCDSKATGTSSVAMGKNAQATAGYSVAIGQNASATHANSVALGHGAQAGATGAVAVGYNANASGTYAFAAATGSASAQRAVAFGSSCKAIGSSSFVANSSNVAEGSNSTALGNGNHAVEYAQTVVGSYNAYENGEITDARFVVGIGGSKARKNGFVVKNDGSAQVSGELSFGDVSTESAKTLVKKASGTYELIEDITLTEDVTRFSRNTDPQGVAYDFSAIRVLMYAPAYAGANSSDQIIFSLSSPKTSSMIYHQASNAVATTAKRTILSAHDQNGFVDYFAVVANHGNVGNVGLRPAILVEPWENISYLNMTTNPSSQVIPAGTRIVIYAVRG